MLFWTIVFITYYVAQLFKGNLYYNSITKGADIAIKQALEQDTDKRCKLGNEFLKVSYPIFLAIILVLIEVIYLVSAIRLDTYRFPTIILIFFTLGSMIFKKKTNAKNYDLNTENGRFNYKTEIGKIKKYSFKTIIVSAVFLGYFCYMFTILIK